MIKIGRRCGAGSFCSLKYNYYQIARLPKKAIIHSLGQGLPINSSQPVGRANYLFISFDAFHG